MFPTPDYDMETETTEPQRRLPRSFVDDPFFSNSDVFRDFPRDFPTRRFGSNPRIFDDDANSFFSEFEPRSSFHSLPRRANSRSPGPAQQQQGQNGGNQSQTERPIPVHRQYQSERSPSRQGSQTIPVRVQQQQEGSPKRVPIQRSSPPNNVNVVNVHPSGEIKEINNAQSTANYTNGELNPDRKAQYQSQSQNQNQSRPTQNQDIPTITINSPVESPPEKKFVKADSTEKQENSVTVEDKGKEENMAKNEENPPTRRLGRGFSLDGHSDKLLDLLDEAEKRVEQLRETAAQLEQEKEQLLDTLNNVKLNAELLRHQGERDDLLINADRILNRCKAVDVVVSTPRNEHQAKALEEVNILLQGVISKMQEDLNNSKETVKRYLNACSPDQPDGPIDQKFQAKIIECTADDQKKIRRKLAQIITQIERAERVVPSV
uniref:BAG family molecular chaperone regulator 2 n=1 Tax=Acrobeloides nanus TaxID=290746 RepID=A0A914DAS4_9BILA